MSFWPQVPFKISIHLYALSSLIIITTMTRHYTYIPPTPVPYANPLPSYAFAPLLDWNNFPHLPQHASKHLLMFMLSKSQTHMYENLKEPYNQGIEVEVTTKDIRHDPFWQNSATIISDSKCICCSLSYHLL